MRQGEPQPKLRLSDKQLNNILSFINENENHQMYLSDLIAVLEKNGINNIQDSKELKWKLVNLSHPDKVVDRPIEMRTLATAVTQILNNGFLDNLIERPKSKDSSRQHGYHSQVTPTNMGAEGGQEREPNVINGINNAKTIDDIINILTNNYNPDEIVTNSRANKDQGYTRKYLVNILNLIKIDSSYLDNLTSSLDLRDKVSKILSKTPETPHSQRR